MKLLEISEALGGNFEYVQQFRYDCAVLRRRVREKESLGLYFCARGHECDYLTCREMHRCLFCYCPVPVIQRSFISFSAAIDLSFLFGLQLYFARAKLDVPGLLLLHQHIG